MIGGLCMLAKNQLSLSNGFTILFLLLRLLANMSIFSTTFHQVTKSFKGIFKVKNIFLGGGSCFRWWSQQFRRVVERFHHIIQGQFTGHSHRDEFNVFYAQANPNLAINYAWNGGATTTYSNVNPNYIVYMVDRTNYVSFFILFKFILIIFETFQQVQEKESWIYSITEANLNPNTFPRWFRQYQFRQHFGITDLSPAGLDHFLVNTLARSRSALFDYFTFKVSAGDPFMAAGCNDECLRSHLCSIVINEFNDMRRCDFLRSLPLA